MHTLELLTGSEVAGYRIEGLAGRGGMGVVYRATQLALGRSVALKLIAPELADDTRFRERFKRESRLAASIDHPNVIPIYEAGESDGSLFLSMRWVEGTDLQTLIKRGGGLEPERAARIVSQIGAALDAAHERGLVHRDVKPANVLIAAGRVEHVYLTDFGLVKRIAGSGDITRSGEFVGTIDYIAPEQIQGSTSDACSDVYSLGCVFFHALTGRVPYDTESEIAKIYAHLNATPPCPSEVVSGLPDELDDVVTRAMAKDLDERYESAGDLGRAAVEASSPTRGAETLALSGWNGRPPERRRRVALWSTAALVIAASLAALLALGGVFGSGESGHAKKGVSGVPRDGTLLRLRGSRAVTVVKAGAKFSVPRRELNLFDYEPRRVRVVSPARLRKIPAIPREGSILRAYGSTLRWVVRRGQRSLVAAPPGAEVALIPSTGLRQVPLPPGRKKTSIVAQAPSSVLESRAFHVTAQVRSPKGTPKGACLAYRMAAGGARERANVPTHHGRCKMRLGVGGFSSVRYLVRFVGDRKWKASKTVTAPIQVIPR